MCAKMTAPASLDEEYYQISPDILGSFPKFRPPLTLYRFNEDVGRIVVLHKAEERMATEKQSEVAALCAQGVVFVSRADHPIYSLHIAKQLDLVLLDENLKEPEIAEIFSHALTDRLAAFYEQPMPAFYELLHKDLMVLTQYLENDRQRIRSLVRRRHAEHTLERHSFNSGMLGLWLLFQAGPEDLSRKVLDRSAIALFLHDMGMSKIQSFIREKTKPLTVDEREKIVQHPLAGSKIALKLELKFDEMQHCLMQHQERMDGSGYPQGLRGEHIAPLGRLCAVADSWSAMTVKRPYAPAKSAAQAAAELARDENRYDRRFTVPLLKAVSEGEEGFGLSPDRVPAQG